MKFASYMAFWYIAFFLVLLVPFFILVYRVIEKDGRDLEPL